MRTAAGITGTKILQSKQREQFLGLHEEGFEFLISSITQDMLFKAEELMLCSNLHVSREY